MSLLPREWFLRVVVDHEYRPRNWTPYVAYNWKAPQPPETPLELLKQAFCKRFIWDGRLVHRNTKNPLFGQPVFPDDNPNWLFVCWLTLPAHLVTS